jgi:hypothetical protein
MDREFDVKSSLLIMSGPEYLVEKHFCTTILYDHSNSVGPIARKNVVGGDFMVFLHRLHVPKNCQSRLAQVNLMILVGPGYQSWFAAMGNSTLCCPRSISFHFMPFV